MNALQRAIDARILHVLHSRREPGELVAVGGAVPVPDRPMMVHVKLERTLEVVEAYNQAVNNRLAGLKVWLVQTPGGVWEILGPRWEANQRFGAGEIGMVPPHGHRRTSGMMDLVEDLRLEPGLVMPTEGLSARIYPFVYIYNGVATAFPGGTVSASGLAPAAGSQRWLIFGIDPATNTATVEGSDPFSTTVNLVEIGAASALAHDFDGLPLAAYNLLAGESSLAALPRWVSLRPWLVVSLDAAQVAYTPTTESDWGTVPDDALAALDELAAHQAHVIGSLGVEYGHQPLLRFLGDVTVVDDTVNAETEVTVGLKDNRSATAAPTASDDGADGYNVGSMWLDVSNQEAYICLDASSGAAVWLSLSTEGVTEVGLSLPSAEFDVSGSPVTDTGTLTGAWKSQDAGEVFAAPGSSGGQPAFRPLAADHIPSLTAAKISDFDTEVGNHTDVAANTSARGKVKVDSSDTAAYLEDQISAGTNVTVSKSGGALVIASSVGSIGGDRDGIPPTASGSYTIREIVAKGAREALSDALTSVKTYLDSAGAYTHTQQKAAADKLYEHAERLSATPYWPNLYQMAETLLSVHQASNWTTVFSSANLDDYACDVWCECPTDGVFTTSAFAELLNTALGVNGNWSSTDNIYEACLDWLKAINRDGVTNGWIPTGTTTGIDDTTCSCSGTCYEYDFTVNNGGWSDCGPDMEACPGAYYQSGTGWEHSDTFVSGGIYRRRVEIEKSFDQLTTIDSITLKFDAVKGDFNSGEVSLEVWLYNGSVYTIVDFGVVVTGNNQELTVSGINYTADRILPYLRVCRSTTGMSGSMTLKSIEICGTTQSPW